MMLQNCLQNPKNLTVMLISIWHLTILCARAAIYTFNYFMFTFLNCFLFHLDYVFFEFAFFCHLVVPAFPAETIVLFVLFCRNLLSAHRAVEFFFVHFSFLHAGAQTPCAYLSFGRHTQKYLMKLRIEFHIHLYPIEPMIWSLQYACCTRGCFKMN